MKRVFIIHGWGSSPNDDWIPWLKKELESKKFNVETPSMPNTDKPKIKEWVEYLKKLDKDIKIGGCIFVAPWFNLIPEPIEEEGGTEIARPWIETPIDFNKVLAHTNKFIALFSDNDPVVPLTDTKLFKERLKAKTIIEKNKGHFNESDGVKEIKVVLDELLKW